MKKKYKESNKNNSNKFIGLFFVLLFAVIFFILFVFILKKSGIWQHINSVEKIRKLVSKGGFFSCLIFVVLQILQTTILQVPSIIVTLAGTLVFGKWLAFILSFFSVVLGSIIMFFIGRKGGTKFLNLMVGKEKTKKLVDRISGCKYLFVLMMLFPFFPDDILCLVAGLTSMSFKFFLITNIVARLIGIGCTIFFGTGAVIPFSGWGLIVWGVILILIAELFYLSIKYQDKIDEFLKSHTNKSEKH